MKNEILKSKEPLMYRVSRFFIFHVSFFICLAAGCLTLGSCEDDFFLDVNPDDLTGRWVVEGTQEYWRFRSDGSGVTWDESEDISEWESNLKFEWTLEGDELTCVFRGENENQAVPKVYRIREISSESMKWEDWFGRTTKLEKR